MKYLLLAGFGAAFVCMLLMVRGDLRRKAMTPAKWATAVGLIAALGFAVIAVR